MAALPAISGHVASIRLKTGRQAKERHSASASKLPKPAQPAQPGAAHTVMQDSHVLMRERQNCPSSLTLLREVLLWVGFWGTMHTNRRIEMRKRKKPYSPSVKKRALRRVVRGESQAAVSRALNIPASTLSGWVVRGRLLDENSTLKRLLIECQRQLAAKDAKIAYLKEEIAYLKAKIAKAKKDAGKSWFGEDLHEMREELRRLNSLLRRELSWWRGAVKVVVGLILTIWGPQIAAEIG